MGTDFHENGRDGATREFSATAVKDGAPTETLVASAVGDRCVNCGATLASDQRYCVICGERRGLPRFSLPATTTTEVMTTTSSISRRGGLRPPRFGSPATLVAGVGTLLLALLVGFLIGNAATKSNTTRPVAAAAPVIKVVNTGGGSSSGSSPAGTATSPSTSSGNASKGSSGGSHKSRTKPKATVSKKQAAAETSAANKTLGGNNTPPASTKVGQKCSGSACNKAGFNKKTHKFDGSFFGQ